MHEDCGSERCGRGGITHGESQHMVIVSLYAYGESLRVNAGVRGVTRGAGEAVWGVHLNSLVEESS